MDDPRKEGLPMGVVAEEVEKRIIAAADLLEEGCFKFRHVRVLGIPRHVPVEEEKAEFFNLVLRPGKTFGLGLFTVVFRREEM